MHTFRAYIFTFVSSEASCFSDFMYLAVLGLLSPLVCVFNRAEDRMFQALERLAVSYTHLTLPTSDLV